VSSNIGTLFYIKSGQLLFKKECDVQTRSKKKQKQYKKSCKRLQDKSLQVKYIVRVAMKNNYLWRFGREYT